MASNVGYFQKWFALGKQLLDGGALNQALNADVVSVMDLAVATGSTSLDALPVSAYGVNVSPESLNLGGFKLVGYPVGAKVYFLNLTGLTVVLYPQTGTIFASDHLNLPPSSGIQLIQFNPGTWLPVSAFGQF